MTQDERKALADALCKQCGGLCYLPDMQIPAEVMRWCLCQFQSAEQESKRRIGFTMKAKKE